MSLTVAFLGHGRIAPGCFRAIALEEGIRVLTVFTHTSSQPGSVEANRELEGFATEVGCPVVEITGTGELRARMEELAPDLLVCIGFLKILPGSVLSIPLLGCVNVHGALLPKYRGRAPISRALLNGEKAVGVTVHYMDEGVDSGDVILQARINVSVQDNALTLFEKIKKLSPSLLVEAVKKFNAGAPEGVQQTDPGVAPYGRITEDDCIIHWDESAERIHDRVRALVRPYPGAFTFLKGTKYFLYKTRPIGKGTGEYEPGEVIQQVPEGLVVGTGDGCLLVEEVGAAGIAAEGGKPEVGDWKVGDVLGLDRTERLT